MTGKTHFTYALITSVACCIQFDVASPEVFLAGSLIGSLLPDIDHKESTIGKLIPLVSKKINKKFGHRKLFHYPVFYALLFAILYFLGINTWLVVGLTLGVFSHLFLDRFNERGTPMLILRKKKKNTSWGKIKVGGFGEVMVSSLICVATLYLIFCMDGQYQIYDGNIFVDGLYYFQQLKLAVL